MSSGRHGLVVREVGRLLGGGTVAALGEGQLLERYAADGDEAAFEALVARHGPMVLGTCRRMLGDRRPHDVDDAFQATFLVLARRAGSIRDADRLGPWLHGVARKVAGRSRARAARLGSREQPGGEERAVVPPDPAEGRELRAVLDEELARLPEKYRVPLVLCYLDGMTHDEAATQLRWPVGTVRSRLAGGRDRLRTRLTRRGLAPTASVPAIAPALALPEALKITTVRLASTSGSVPAAVAGLAKGVLLTMTGTKLQTMGAVTLMAALTAGTAGALARSDGDGPEINTVAQVETKPAQSPADTQGAAEKTLSERESLKQKLDQTSKQADQLKKELEYLELKLKRLSLAATEPTDEEVRKQLDLARKKIEELEMERALQDLKITAYEATAKVQARPAADGAVLPPGRPNRATPSDRTPSPLPGEPATPPPAGRTPFDLAFPPPATAPPPSSSMPTAPPAATLPPPPAGRVPFDLADNPAPPPASPPPTGPATVLALNTPGYASLSVVISGGRDRITVIDLESKKRDTFRPGGTVATAEMSNAGTFATLRLAGEGLGRAAIFDRRDDRWSTVEVGSAATSLHPYSLGGAVGVRPVIGYAIAAPEVRRLVAFDLAERKWATQDLAEPVKGSVTPAMTYDTASYLAGRTIWVYGAVAKKWSGLELKQPMSPQDFRKIMSTVAMGGSNQIVIPDGDLIHVYDPKTGDWAHINVEDDK